jgi:beta-galactosidase
VLSLIAALTLAPAQPVWIEAETPAFSSNHVEAEASAHPEWLSGGRWIRFGYEPDKLPADEPLLRYEFEAPAGGRNEVWNRLGFEDARSPIEWRIDEGAWQRVDPEKPTIDTQELSPWTQVAWLKLGEQDLTAGKHRIELRILRSKDALGKPQRLLYASDALVVAPSFRPFGKWKPGEDPRTPQDLEAAQRIVAAPEPAGPEPQTVPLGGLWEICRDDEERPTVVGAPIERLPENPVWSAIQVPGDKAEVRPDLSLAHRVWYRLRIQVAKPDRSYRLTFHQNSLNTTVYVNGRLCGFNKNPFVEWTCDVTPAVKAGANEVMVGIRDAWYGFKQDPDDPAVLRKSFALPRSFERQGFLRLAYPVWGCFASGLLVTPDLTVGGRTYASDVFIKPSVAKHRLDAAVTLKNDGERPSTGALVVEVEDPETKKIVAQIARQPYQLAAGEERVQEVGGPWADPVLWWPDQPKMYRLRTSLIPADGPPVEISSTPFGFREWTADGPNYRLNGVVWHGWAELNQGRTPDEWLANYRAHGQRFMRMMGPAQNGSSVRWMGMPYRDALDWCDRNGVTVRRSGPLDGEAIGYMAIEENPKLRAKYGTEINQELLNNVRDQIVAQVRGERNHPSVNVWSVENEWLYINCINLYGGLMDAFEGDMKRTLDAVMQADPTRLPMVDGGGAGKANLFPIHGDHYVYTNRPDDYPDLAYTAQPNGGGRGRWTWDGNRPRYAGEDFYASGINPADYAWIQGEEAFGGKTAAHRGIAQVQRMLTEGYRWGGFFTAWHLWVGDEGKEFHDKYVANRERAVFVRERDWSFASGQKVARTFGVFNDSRYSDPITLTWSVSAGGKAGAASSKILTIAPGASQKFGVSLTIPVVATRTPGKLTLSLKAAGKEVFYDEKPLTILAPASPPKVAGARSQTIAKHLQPAAGPLAVYDPEGKVATYLTGQKVAFRRLTTLANLPSDARVLLIGPDALSEAQSTDPRLAAYALDGHRVLLLEQKNPLKYQALPAAMEAENSGGAYGFVEDPTHPALRGLASSDFQAWGGRRLYERAYLKPERGARSLVQVGERLSRTALAELPLGEGLLVLCQLEVGQNLATEAPARQLLANLVDYAQTYRRIERPVRSAVSDPQLKSALDAIGLKHSEVADPLKAIAQPGIAIVSATPENLRKLAANLPAVRAFNQAGGSLVLHGLTPEGLADYNRIVGVEHLIRPFRQERTTLVAPRDPLTIGITQGDVVMYSGQRMFDYNDDMFVADDIFSYIVDVDDVAPFAKLPSDALLNTVNGFVSGDSWKYIFSFDLKGTAKPAYTMEFPKPLPFREMTWIGNGFYHKVKRIALSFDGKDRQVFDVEPNTEPQTLTISPARTARSVKLEILEWTDDPGVTDVVGIDNIYLRINRAPDWEAKVRPMLNVGGLVHYPRGKGDIVLVNLRFQEKEAVAANVGKKRAILAAILRNLKAQFSAGARTVIAGARGIEYEPVSFAGKANAYRNERGWFGDAGQTFADLPAGRQVLANVPFELYDFKTSPVPTAILLGGPGVPGNLPERVEEIPVGRKASALFFLHTARLDQRRNDQEIRQGKRFEMARYLVRYADGQTVKVPVYAEIDMDDFRQKDPHDLPGARVAWMKRYPNSDLSATAYVMQWNNPRPDVSISWIGLEYGADRRGIPALLAVTAAK